MNEDTQSIRALTYLVQIVDAVEVGSRKDSNIATYTIRTVMEIVELCA